MLLINRKLLDNVVFYPANIITYFRYILLAPFCYFSHSAPILFILIGCFSSLLDLADGYVAKISGKKSSYGAILDMTIDRLYYSIGIIVLSKLYPDYTWFFYIVLIIDITSHYVVIHATSLLQIKSHKLLFLRTESTLLKNYYSSNRIFMIISNVSYTTAMIILYLYKFYPSNVLFYFCLFSLLLATIQILINIIQLSHALKLVITYDTE